jgi:hypothetical protein
MSPQPLLAPRSSTCSAVSGFAAHCRMLALPFGPRPTTGEPNGRVSVQARDDRRRAGRPPSFSSAVQNWAPGDDSFRPQDRAGGCRAYDDADQPPVLVVRDMSG